MTITPAGAKDKKQAEMKMGRVADDLKRAYILPYRERRRLHGRAYRAQQRGDLEVCGVVIAWKDRRIELHFIKNLSNEPGHFEIDMQEIKAIRNNMKGKDKRILGMFHSHPASEAIPGPGDLRSSFYNGYSMIYDVCGRETKLWSLLKTGKKKKAREVPLILEPRK